MAKEKRSKAAIHRTFTERLNYPAYGIEIGPGASGSDSWYISPYNRGAPESIVVRASEIGKEVQTLYMLEDEPPKAKK
jgi:hypothetical protein